MSFAVLFRAREYLRGSLWVFPLAGAIAGVLLAALTKQADTSVTVPKGLQYDPATASTVLTTIVGATVGLAGFVVTVTVRAIQMATGTFSARYMRIWYRDRLLKAVLTVLTGTLTFSFSLLRQVSATRGPRYRGQCGRLAPGAQPGAVPALLRPLHPPAQTRRGGRPRRPYCPEDHYHGHPGSRGRHRIRPDAHRRASAHGVEPTRWVYPGHRCPRPDQMGQQAPAPARHASRPASTSMTSSPPWWPRARTA
jgi:hypothetical protein